MRVALLALLLVSGLAGSARGQRAMAPAARAELERGLAAYRERDWSAAIDAFRAGYAIDPHPDFLFPWAQATRLSGDCRAALPLYRRALDSARSDEDRRDIESLIARCEEEVARARPAPGPAPPAPIHAAVHLHPPPAPAARSAWYADRLGGALAIGGAVALATGVGFLVAARRADDAAAGAGTLDGFVTASDTADQRRAVGAIALGAGAGIAAVAVLRYARVAHLAAHEPAVAIAPAPGGAVFAVGGGF